MESDELHEREKDIRRQEQKLKLLVDKLKVDNGWSSDIVDYVGDIGNQCARYTWLAEQEYKRYDFLDTVFKILTPSILLFTGAGNIFTVAINNNTFTDPTTQETNKSNQISIVINTMVVILAGILDIMSGQLKFLTKAKSFKVAQLEFFELHDEIQLMFTLPTVNRQNGVEYADYITSKFRDIRKKMVHTISNDTKKKFKKVFSDNEISNQTDYTAINKGDVEETPRIRSARKRGYSLPIQRPQFKNELQINNLTMSEPERVTHDSDDSSNEPNSPITPRPPELPKDVRRIIKQETNLDKLAEEVNILQNRKLSFFTRQTPLELEAGPKYTNNEKRRQLERYMANQS